LKRFWKVGGKNEKTTRTAQTKFEIDDQGVGGGRLRRGFWLVCGGEFLMWWEVWLGLRVGLSSHWIVNRVGG